MQTPPEDLPTDNSLTQFDRRKTICSIFVLAQNLFSARSRLIYMFVFSENFSPSWMKTLNGQYNFYLFFTLFRIVPQKVIDNRKIFAAQSFAGQRLVDLVCNCAHRNR